MFKPAGWTLLLSWDLREGGRVASATGALTKLDRFNWYPGRSSRTLDKALHRSEQGDVSPVCVCEFLSAA